ILDLRAGAQHVDQPFDDDVQNLAERRERALVDGGGIDARGAEEGFEAPRLAERLLPRAGRERTEGLVPPGPAGVRGEARRRLRRRRADRIERLGGIEEA